MRGEHRGRGRLAHDADGSSPLARGARVGRGADRGRRGIIPACAGSTPPSRGRSRRRRDHPRLRGEHVSRSSSHLSGKGSSPLARGARSSLLGVEEVSGIIPACAGSTSVTRCAAEAGQDHPRLRGEHSSMPVDGSVFPGSSPLARGARETASGRREMARIIPACAGSTRGRPSASTAQRDHPRLRGEHPSRLSPQQARGGSSPLARGAQRFARNATTGSRIIPACAGSTPCASAAPLAREDHPRLRGEHTTSCPQTSARRGSSPLARGARDLRA